MNKSELIDYISEKAELTKASASRALEAFLEGVIVSLQEGNPAVLTNFGTFVVKERAARKGRNPVTGAEININATKVVGFKPGKALKEAVKEPMKEEIDN